LCDWIGFFGFPFCQIRQKGSFLKIKKLSVTILQQDIKTKLFNSCLYLHSTCIFISFSSNISYFVEITGLMLQNPKFTRGWIAPA